MIVTVKTVLKYTGLMAMMIASLAFLIWYMPGPHAQGTLLTMELLIFGPAVLLACVSLIFAVLVMFGKYIVEFSLIVEELIKRFLNKEIWRT